MPPELHVLTPTCTRSFVRWGFAPDPTGGAYSAPPDSLAVFRGPTSKGREGEWRGAKKRGKGEERGGRREKGKGYVKKKSRRL